MATTTKEVEVTIDAPPAAALSRTKTGLRISEIDPDLNKDGKVDAHEKKIFDILKEADADNSGFLTTQEVYKALTSFVEGERTSSQRKKMLIAAVIICLIMLAANIGLTACIVFLAKDTQVGKGGAMLTKTGKSVGTAGLVSKVKLFDYAGAKDVQLAKWLQSPITVTKGSKGESMMFTVVGYSKLINGTTTTLVMRTADAHVMHLTKSTLKVYLGTKLVLNKAVKAGRRLEKETGPTGPVKGEETISTQTVEAIDETLVGDPGEAVAEPLDAEETLQEVPSTVEAAPEEAISDVVEGEAEEE